MFGRGVFTFEGVRAAENPVVNVQLGQDPILTGLVLGQPQRLVFPGARILPATQVPSWLFQITTFGDEHLELVDTERGMRAPIKHGDWRAETTPRKLRRHSYRVLKDQDEITNALPNLRISERSSGLARRIVMMDIERRRRDLLIDPATYDPTHVLAIAGSSEWDSAGGDSRADVRAMAAAIVADTGFQTQEITVFLSHSSLEAAKDDPVFLGKRANFDTDTPDEDVLAAYWGVGRVWSGEMVSKNDAGVVVPFYGDVAILYVEPATPEYDTEWGDLDFGRTFTWNRGVASVPWYDPVHTSWSFPWTDYAQPEILTPNAAALITNTSSAV